jgi:four helix bundle protein
METAVVFSRMTNITWISIVKGMQVAPGRATLDDRNPGDWWKGMNITEVSMPQPLIVTEKATEAAGAAIRLAMTVKAPLKSLADQVIRSASSVPANLSEGHGRVGRDRAHFWRIAYGSAKEVDVHLRLLVTAGAIDATRADRAIRSFDEVRAMTWRLLHPK